MAGLIMVWDKSGEPFEVRPDVAKNLILVQGWAGCAPKAQPEPESSAPPVEQSVKSDAGIASPSIKFEGVLVSPSARV